MSEEQHQGGEIQHKELIGRDDGPEFVTLPEGTQVKPAKQEIEPLTYTKFLGCLDKHIYEGYKRPHHASVNGGTLSFLIDSIPQVPCPSFPLSNECVVIAGVEMEIDGQLPDHAIRLEGEVYNVVKPEINPEFTAFLKDGPHHFELPYIPVYRLTGDKSELIGHWGEESAQEKDITLERITKDVQRAMADKPSAQIIREILARYEPIDTKPSARDAQFAGASEALWLGIDALSMHHMRDGILGPERVQEYRQLTAKFLYDFACHIVSNVSQAAAEFREAELFTAQEIVDDLPDMKEWLLVSNGVNLPNREDIDEQI